MRKIYIVVLSLFVSVAAHAVQPDGSIEATDITIDRSGSAVRLEMTLRISPDAVTKCQSVAVVPTLYSPDGSSVSFPYMLINGLKARQVYERRSKFGFTELRNNPPHKVINVDKKYRGETVKYSAEIADARVPQDALLKLGFWFSSCAGENHYYTMETSATVAVPATVVVIQEPKIEPDVPSVTAPPAKEPVIKEEAIKEEPTPAALPTAYTDMSFAGSMYLDFPADSYDILSGYGNNARELEAIRAVFDKIKDTPDAIITELSITGYASPEGRYANNERLAYDRTLSVAKYLQSIYGIPMKDTRISSVAEDWKTLGELVSKANMPYKNEVQNIINSTDHPDVKESKLRRLGSGSPWKYMSDNLFPQLRRVEYKVNYKARGE